MLLGGNVAFRGGNARMPERHGKLFDRRVAFMGQPGKTSPQVVRPYLGVHLSGMRKNDVVDGLSGKASPVTAPHFVISRNSRPATKEPTRHHSSTAALAQMGTATVRMRRCLPTRSAMTHQSSTIRNCSTGTAAASSRRMPQPRLSLIHI